MAQLSKWRSEGDKLTVCLNTNEHIYRKALGKSLTNIEGLEMKEVVGEFTGKAISSMFFGGSKPIDRIWATSDITICKAAIMPAGYGIGDDRLFVIDFASNDIIGMTSPKVVCLASRRLNTKLPCVPVEYSRLLEEMVIKHCLIECIGKAHASSRPRQSFTRCLNR